MIITFNWIMSSPKQKKPSMPNKKDDEFDFKQAEMQTRVLQKLNQNFYLFHVHHDYSVPISNSYGYKWVTKLETSFLRKDLVDEEIVQISLEYYPSNYNYGTYAFPA